MTNTGLRNRVRDAIFEEDYALSGLMSNEVLDVAIAVVLEDQEQALDHARTSGILDGRRAGFAEALETAAQRLTEVLKYRVSAPLVIEAAAKIRALGTEKD